ncbi:hypothetical protein R1flu_002266 [Riccia fluitans]|uniref:Isopropylmalate dehydrogenase-like domain-containing protein n=1 Tax=Riccia fluitans TaxID=41844 RepID=A0ABD1Y5P9_9MARC
MQAAAEREGIKFEFTEKLVGGGALDGAGVPLPDDTLASCRASDTVLLASIGRYYKWDSNPPHLKPETGLLGLRAGLGVFANLRPVTVLPQALSSIEELVLQLQTQVEVLKEEVASRDNLLRLLKKEGILSSQSLQRAAQSLSEAEKKIIELESRV